MIRYITYKGSFNDICIYVSETENDENYVDFQDGGFRIIIKTK